MCVETLKNQNQKPIIQFKLYDPTTKEGFKHVTYFITIEKDGKKLLSDWFHDHNGDLKIDIDGFDLYERLKKIDPNIKACFLTASEMYHEEFRKSEHCALDKDLFLQKPISNDDLIMEINRKMSLHNSNREIKLEPFPNDENGT